MWVRESLRDVCRWDDKITTGMRTFGIHMSVHRNIIPNYSQQDTTFYLFISTDALDVSGGSSAHLQEHINCTYSFRYCQPILLLTATVEEMELSSIR